MPVRQGGGQRNVAEQVDELRQKIQLLEGDRKAYYESSEWTIKQNKEKIGKLRKECKELHKLKADRLAADEHVIQKGLEEHPTERKAYRHHEGRADEHVVNKGLQDHPKERNALRDKPGAVAIVKMDEKVRDRVNVLNNMKYKTVQMQKKLEGLQTQHDQMVKDASEAVATDAGESEDAQKLRNLENRLDKAQLKYQEAEHIRKTYLQIKAKYEEEHQGFENTLKDMEEEIKRCRQELKDLRAMHHDAIIARDAAKQELEKQEREVYADRRQRELELARVKKEAEEKRMLHERIDRRIARGSITQEDLSSADRQAMMGEEEQQKINTYEEAFRRIKEATGVSDTKEVVIRFENQGETKEHLQNLMKEAEKSINRLREEREKKQQEFEEMKYTGEAKLSSGQRLLEDYEAHLHLEEGRRDESQKKLEKSSKILTSVKSGVEHLAEKLAHLKATSSQVQKAQIAPSSDEYVLDQLSVTEEKLLKLMEELDGKDLDEVVKQMEEEEYHNTAEMKLPTYNTRVKLPQTQRDNVYDDEDDSGEDEDVLTRQNIKRQAQQIVDAKTKRRVAKRKKKTK